MIRFVVRCVVCGGAWVEETDTKLDALTHVRLTVGHPCPDATFVAESIGYDSTLRSCRTGELANEYRDRAPPPEARRSVRSVHCRGSVSPVCACPVCKGAHHGELRLCETRRAGRPRHALRRDRGRETEGRLAREEEHVSANGAGDYAAFLDAQDATRRWHGFRPRPSMPDFLFGFQTALVEWAIAQGPRGASSPTAASARRRCNWSGPRTSHRHTGKPVLIADAAGGVASRRKREAAKFGIDAGVSRDGVGPAAPITITNYERLQHFDRRRLRRRGLRRVEHPSSPSTASGAAIVTEFMRKMPYRLLCTATAAPNDYIELGTSSEALGYLGHMDMLGRFFEPEQRSRHQGPLARPRRAAPLRGQQWRFKGHAEEPFWRWVASWARAHAQTVRPRLRRRRVHPAAARAPPARRRRRERRARTRCSTCPAIGLHEEREEPRRTITERCEQVAELVDHAEPAVAWCHLNAEGDLLDEADPRRRPGDRLG